MRHYQERKRFVKLPLALQLQQDPSLESWIRVLPHILRKENSEADKEGCLEASWEEGRRSEMGKADFQTMEEGTVARPFRGTWKCRQQQGT